MDADWKSVREIDWLRYDWRFEIAPCQAGSTSVVNVSADGVCVATFEGKGAAEHWVASRRIECLAELIAHNPHLHPVEVIIDAGGG